MVGDQDIAIVDGDVPFDRIALQMAKFAVGDGRRPPGCGNPGAGWRSWPDSR
jgi:hypothetical protein